MFVAVLVTLCIQFSAACVLAVAVESDDVRVRIEVHLSEVAAAEAGNSDIYVAGNVPALGVWRPDGLKLHRESEGLFSGEFAAVAGSDIQFKVTRGTWRTVERDGRGGDVANRRIRVLPPEGGGPVKAVVEVARWSSGGVQESSITGQVVQLGPQRSAFLRRARRVTVWLPEGYSESGDRYPVLYLQDGQNVFDAATAAFGVEWRVDETAARLIRDDRIMPVIVVAIWNSVERTDEYTVTSDEKLVAGGRGADYIRFLVQELKPLIDASYRTKSERQFTWIGGSSLGALISMHACMQQPEVFGGCLAFSPSLGWDREQILKQLDSAAGWPKDVRLWVSMGSAEGADEGACAVNLQRARRLFRQLQPEAGGITGRWCFREFAGAGHNEKSWSEQFPESLEWLTGGTDG